MDPSAAIAGSLALLFRPPLMDILPMYVLFSFLTPAVFALAAAVTATFLKYLNRWEAPLQPLMLIGRHMLPVFCSQICLSVVLIGRTESNLTNEPITSALVICQLLTAPLFAWFLELRSVPQPSARSNTFRDECSPPNLACGDAHEKASIAFSHRPATSSTPSLERSFQP
jgi:hypothetical protein